MCKTRLDTKIHPRFRRGCKVRESRGVIVGPAVDAGVGATRRRKYGTARGCESRGNSSIHPLAQSKERGFGVTRKLTVGTAGRCRMRGNSQTHHGASGGAKIRGDPEIHSPDDSAGCAIRGNSMTHPLAQPQERGFEVTRKLTVGTAGRSRTRGNPRIHPKAVWNDA